MSVYFQHSVCSKCLFTFSIVSVVNVCGGTALSTVQSEHYNWMMAFHGNMDQTYCPVGILTHLRAQVERGLYWECFKKMHFYIY